MLENKKERLLPSAKYKNMLLPIKAKLMKEIAKYFKDGKFNMNRQTVLHYPLGVGSLFGAQFDSLEGDENKFNLIDSTRPWMVIMKFDASNEVSAAEDVAFLMTLLDYVDMDSRA